eukprot:1079573-Pelagomonas_calceolata.AAC.16
MCAMLRVHKVACTMRTCLNGSVRGGPAGDNLKNSQSVRTADANHTQTPILGPLTSSTCCPATSTGKQPPSRQIVGPERKHKQGILDYVYLYSQNPRIENLIAFACILYAGQNTKKAQMHKE